MIPVFDLREQYRAIELEIATAIEQVLFRGQFILGDEVRLFEEEFASYCDSSHAVGVGSGTMAIYLALVAYGIGPGDEVITTANGSVATVAAIGMTGATPVFVDVDRATMVMDVGLVPGVITDKTAAIIPVHLYGHPVELIPLMVSSPPVIEDCAQAHGALYRTYPIGSWGDVGCFSFYPTKNLGAYGDGGMVVTDSVEVADRLRALRQYGWVEPSVHRVSHIRGVNSRLDELQAAILRVKLGYLDVWNEARRERALMYTEGLAGTELVCPMQADWARHAYHLYVVRCQVREKLRAHLGSQGIQTAIHYPVPIHLQPAYRDLGYEVGDLPVTEMLADEVLTLPLYPELSLEKVQRVIECIKEGLDAR
jgi:dTDP-4-amino-4,6-dideoxygalactose transaminase